jgi:hypothetical protein
MRGMPRAIEDRLLSGNELVLRYKTEHTKDGLPAGEGALSRQKGLTEERAASEWPRESRPVVASRNAAAPGRHRSLCGVGQLRWTLAGNVQN